MKSHLADEVVATGSPIRPRLSGFAIYAWCVLVYNLAVVAWGAFVRATGSGAGCGNHWPLCNGVAIPQSPQLATIIEFSHRLTAGLSTLAVIGLAAGSFRVFPPKHPARRAAVFAVVFTFLEALIGAGLVLAQKVAQDQSFARVVYLSVHLINTFLLVGAIALTAWWASGTPRMAWKQAGNWRWAALAGLLATLLLGVSGAVTALGDTLYPSKSLAEGLRSDFAPTTNLLIRFRIYHPLIAILVGGYLGTLAILAMLRRSGALVRPLAATLLVLIATQWALGALDVVLLAPFWLQLVHLLLADLLWVAAVLMSAALVS
ncbi:MAG: Heme synthase, cytochrome oxidase biosis protein Cox15-CtaA [Bryobacterales bacterium]|nr:Heme synthase, cytochrome oxidase biosis protein Cox15-CtaA [Bryobacterales bacterium]